MNILARTLSFCVLTQTQSAMITFSLDYIHIISDIHVYCTDEGDRYCIMPVSITALISSFAATWQHRVETCNF